MFGYGPPYSLNTGPRGQIERTGARICIIRGPVKRTKIQGPVYVEIRGPVYVEIRGPVYVEIRGPVSVETSSSCSFSEIEEKCQNFFFRIRTWDLLTTSEASSPLDYQDQLCKKKQEKSGYISNGDLREKRNCKTKMADMMRLVHLVTQCSPSLLIPFSRFFLLQLAHINCLVQHISQQEPSSLQSTQIPVQGGIR